MARRNFSVTGCSMKITEDVRKYATEHGISEIAALEKGLKENRRSLLKKALTFTRKCSFDKVLDGGQARAA